VIVGVGIDIVDVQQLRRMTPTAFQRLAHRVLTEAELEYCLSQPDPHQCLAARFAAKEALAKALQLPDPHQIPFKDAEILGAPPRLKATGKALQALKEKNATHIHVSLSHTPTTATAIVILEAQAD